MLFSDPKWGNGCLALIGVVAFVFLWGAAERYLGWHLTLPTPFGQILGFLILLALARFVVNQIFD